jgi:cytochrome c556
MRRWAGVLIPVAGTTALLAVAGVASSEDGKAAFERREDTMKHMGRPFYLGIGRVVKGTAAYGPDTVTAAETVASIASTLIAAVQAATAQLVPAVKTGDKAAISAAYTAVYNACNACHTQFRQEE